MSLRAVSLLVGFLAVGYASSACCADDEATKTVRLEITPAALADLLDVDQA